MDLLDQKGYDSKFYLNNFYEYEQGSALPIIKGRVKAAYNFWVEIDANPDVLDIISSGYKLPLLHTPPPCFMNNNQSAFKHSDFVTDAISELLENNLIIERSVPPSIVNPLSVSVQNSGKKHLILDLRYINKFLWKEKVSFEDWKEALEIFQKEDFFGLFRPQIWLA